MYKYTQQLMIYTLMSGVGYQDKSSEQIERDIITVVDREIQQAVRGK